MPRAPLPQAEFEEIYAQGARLTVEVVIVSPDGVCSPAAKPDYPGGYSEETQWFTDGIHRRMAETHVAS